MPMRAGDGVDRVPGLLYGPTGRSGRGSPITVHAPHTDRTLEEIALSSATHLDAATPSTEGVPTSRDRILDTAEALFARRGFEGVGLREVARLSELSKSALFHHFPTKIDLYAAVLERILGDVLGCIADLPTTGGALARLRVLVETIVDTLAGSPTRAPLLLRTLFEADVLEGHETPVADAMLERILGTAMDIMREGVESGDLRPIPVPHALQAIVGMLVFHFASGELGDDVLGHPVYSAPEIRRFKQFAVSFIDSGLRARPSTP